MELILFLLFLGWSFWIIYNSIFLPERIEKKIKEGDLIYAYELSKLSFNPEIRERIVCVITEDCKSLQGLRVSQLSVKELMKLARYMGILKKPSIDFYPLIIEAKRRENRLLLKKIKESHTSKTWRNNLQVYLDKDKDAG